MNKLLLKYVTLACPFLLLLIYYHSPVLAKNYEDEKLILTPTTEKTNLYSSLYILKDNEKLLSIEDVSTGEYTNEFVHSDKVSQKIGFFESAKWLRFEVDNQTDETEWLLEFAFPLIYYINIYSEDETGIKELEEAGANFQYSNRKIKHRNFIFHLDVEPNEIKTFYILVHGGGDLHPPINIWERDAFIEKTQLEFILLGLVYGMIFIMILYNLFLYIGLRMKSYLYYVLAISLTMVGQLSINGFGFQYLWPSFPAWNLISAPVWVSFACIFILLFTRNFLDTDKYLPIFKRISAILIGLNSLVVLILFISHYTALNLMVISATSTFFTVLTTSFICLKRGARQAKYFALGWTVFLIGVLLTIIERAAILPFSAYMEYAGQASLSIEVTLLSLALADKINIMREEKEYAELEARRSEKLAIESLKEADELKDEFLAITSHELRTPLYGMVGIAESLHDGILGDISTKMKNQLSLIVTSGNRLTNLVNEILDFSKIKNNSLTMDFKPIHLGRIVDVVFTICQPLIKNDQIKLINKVPHSLPPIKADQNRIQQILYNLIGNAIEFTDYGEVIISVDQLDECIRVNVSDTGKGISKKQMKKIFEPFQQVDHTLSRSVGGTGIGLNITKELINLHGGELSVTSKQDKGSVFSFTLPLRKELDDDEAAVTVAKPFFEKVEKVIVSNVQTKRNSGRILVADDEPVNLQVLVNQLTLEGYEVITTSSGQDVINIIEKESVELLILDIMMPGMSGFEVCQQVRQKYTLMELPILMLTAKNQVNDKVTSFQIGANDYLAKPCEKEELLARVHTLIQLYRLNKSMESINVDLEELVKERTESWKITNSELESANQNLIQMTESRQHLLANIAHELGTPVTVIHGYIQAVKEGLFLEDNPRFLKIIENKVHILDRLIDDLFDLSKLEAGEMELKLDQVDSLQITEEILNKAEIEVLQSNRQFDRPSYQQDLIKEVTLLVDKDRLDQIFSNLIWNSIRHTEELTGSIGISIQFNKQNNELIYEVKDNGIGISEEELPFIFDRFYKAKLNTSEEDSSGTGLGLAIVKEIVENHNGRVDVDSELGIGSSFYVILPTNNLIE